MPFHRLIRGFKSFQGKYFYEQDGLYKTLTEKGQSPEVLVIACSDSRNDPALLTQSEPGDMFVIRNVAAIVPPYQPDSQYHGTSAAIEFAIKGLKVKDIVVLGHALCGGVAALMQGSEKNASYEFLNNWIHIGEYAKTIVKQDLENAPLDIQLRALEQAMILTSIHNLMTFPWIKDAVIAGRLTLHGWYFDMGQGKMLGLDFAKGVFADISATSLADAFSKRSQHFCECSIEKMVKKHSS